MPVAWLLPVAVPVPVPVACRVRVLMAERGTKSAYNRAEKGVVPLERIRLQSQVCGAEGCARLREGLRVVAFLQHPRHYHKISGEVSGDGVAGGGG